MAGNGCPVPAVNQAAATPFFFIALSSQCLFLFRQIVKDAISERNLLRQQKSQRVLQRFERPTDYIRWHTHLPTYQMHWSSFVLFVLFITFLSSKPPGRFAAYATIDLSKVLHDSWLFFQFQEESWDKVSGLASPFQELDISVRSASEWGKAETIVTLCLEKQVLVIMECWMPQELDKWLS